MAAVGITENVKGDAKKFEIWYNAREEVYIIQVTTCKYLLNNNNNNNKIKTKGVNSKPNKVYFVLAFFFPFVFNHILQYPCKDVAYTIAIVFTGAADFWEPG